MSTGSLNSKKTLLGAEFSTTDDSNAFTPRRYSHTSEADYKARRPNEGDSIRLELRPH